VAVDAGVEEPAPVESRVELIPHPAARVSNPNPSPRMPSTDDPCPRRPGNAVVSFAGGMFDGTRSRRS
jgi:hypothetical protein